jgi:outer membrane protein X
MKKMLTAAICAALLAIATIPASAQRRGDLAWGVQGAISGESSLIGLGAKLRYNVTDPFRLQGSLTFFPENDYLSAWDFSVDAQWLFPVDANITLYPMAGLGFFNYRFDRRAYDMEEWHEHRGHHYSHTHWGLNLGGGADFRVADNMDITLELKYGTAADDLFLAGGVAFHF